MLHIADEWFELHISQSCASEECNEMISIPVHINDQLVKDEGNELDVKCDDDSVDMKFDTEINFDSMSSISSSEASVAKFETRVRKAESKSRPKKGLSKTKVKKTFSEKPPATTQVKQSTRTAKCRICKQKILRKRLIEHLQLRHVPKTMDIPTCETCGKTFSTPGNLRLHQYLHADRGRYICSYCGKDFVRNANLKEHINLHTVSSINFCLTFRIIICFTLIPSGCTTVCVSNL